METQWFMKGEERKWWWLLGFGFKQLRTGEVIYWDGEIGVGENLGFLWCLYGINFFFKGKLMKLGLEFGWGQMIFEKQTWGDFPRHFLYHTEIYFCFIVWILFSTKTPAARIRSLLVKCHTPWFPMSCGWKVPGWLHLSRWSLWNSPWETIVGLRVPRLAGWGALIPRENVISSFICCIWLLDGEP